MAQFDVHRNTGKQREAIPYVIIVQSSLFDSYRRRVVIPLVRRSNLASSASFVDLPLNPVFIVEGIEVILHPLEIVSLHVYHASYSLAKQMTRGNACTSFRSHMSRDRYVRF